MSELSSRQACVPLRLVILLAALLLMPCAAFTQTDQGRIVGTVRDSNNAVVPNASVTVCNNSTGMMSCAVQGAEGRQFKAAAHQLFQSHIDQIGQVIFGARSLDHHAQKRFAGRWTVGLQVQRLLDEGQMPSARARVIVADQVSR